MGSRTLVGTGSDGLGEVGPGEKKPAADVEIAAELTAVSPPTATIAEPNSQSNAAPTGQTTESSTAATVRPTRLTPGGSALAALLTQNRAKGGRADGGEGSGPVPRPTRSTPSGGSFDLLDITAVGDAVVEEKTDVGPAKRPVPARQTRLTPATDGLPALLAQTGWASATSEDGAGKVMAPISTRLTPSVPGIQATDDLASGGAVVTQRVETVGPDTGGTPVGAAGGGTPVGAAGDKDSSASRPMRLTPGSGGLAALLAQTRSRTGKHDTLEKKTSAAASDAGVPTAGSSRPSEPIVSAQPTEAGVVISVPQEKSHNFASTLMGVPAPEINLPRPLEVVRQPAPSGPAYAPNDAGDSAGARARVGSGERFRTTELVDTVGRGRRSRIVVGVAVAAVVIVLALVLIPSRKPKPTGQASRAVPRALPTESSPPVAHPAVPVPGTPPVTPEQGAEETAVPTVPAAAGEETATKDDVQEKARLAADAAKAAQSEEREKARVAAKAAKAAKADEEKRELAEAKAAKAAKADEQKKVLAEAKAAKAEAKKKAIAEAMDAKAKAVKAGVEKPALAEARTAKGGKDEAAKQALADAKAAKAEAQKQARAEVKATKAAKTEAQKQARAEARAEARATKAATKAEAQAGGETGLPWEASSAGSGPGVAARRPANLTETSRSKSSVPPRPIDDPDATLPLSTR